MSARELAQSVPADVDLVVGIPRSGLLAANLLCLTLDRPMTDVDGLLEGRLLQTGHRYDGTVTSFEDLDRVLVVDDSVKSGTQMRETQSRLDDADLPFDIEYAAVYISQRGHNFVDYWAEVVDTPRVFEWNLMHHPKLKSACFDIDGVLCRDPTTEENDDGDNYREFLTTVDPRIVPSVRIGCLVTSRLEKYRPETEQWLADHGIVYDTLVMMDAPDMASRRKANNHAGFKADVYASSDATLFVESDENQAVEIAKRSHKPVYCYETNQMVRPGVVAETYSKSQRHLSTFAANPVSFVATAATYLTSQCYNRLTLATRKYLR